MPKEILRILFLREFIKNLILSVKIEPLPEIPTEIEEEDELSEIKISPDLKKKSFPSLISIPEKRFALRAINSLTTKTPSTKSFAPKMPTSPVQQKTPTRIVKATTPFVQPTKGYPDLGKLNSLVADPGVENIECPGPNNHLLVKKSGRVQKTNILLTNIEIKKILKDFSEKTKIPLIKGTFKAALGNLILTAIVSEFAGTKFILQKKNPLSFQPPL
tara:strand:+ start:808 stop:1458 length:651 start_codon:yes stop_codon:yes gene_type:complete